MAGAQLEKTRWPGIYRRGRKFVYEWTDAHGKRRRATTDTRERASTSKAEAEANAARGVLGDEGPRGRVTLASYALELYGADLGRPKDSTPVRGRYIGRRGAVRDSTRNEYRRDIEAYWLPVLGPKGIGKITPRDVSRVLAALAARDGDKTADRSERYLSDRSLKRLFAPFGALMAEAVEEGLLATNPARDVKVPSGRDVLRRFDADDSDDDDPAPGKARALTRAELDTFLLVVDVRWRLSSSCSRRRACGSARRSRFAGATSGSMAHSRSSAYGVRTCGACSDHPNPSTAGATSRSHTTS